jgi:hypothetical protein
MTSILFVWRILIWGDLGLLSASVGMGVVLGKNTPMLIKSGGLRVELWASLVLVL